jgi:membrane protein YqaA with SNARE-associated domain
MDSRPATAAVPWFRRPLVWLRGLYDWTLGWAHTPYGSVALFILAFVEASFFPIPPDVLLMALALGRPRRSFHFVTVCTAGSVLGAILGWYIGLGLWASFGVDPSCPQYAGGQWLFEVIPGFTCERFGTVRELYDSNAWLTLFTAAFTVIPYKVFTIAAGVFNISLVTLVAASIVGRGARFALVGGLIFYFGPQVKEFIEKRFDTIALVFTVLLIGGFVLIKYAL